MTYADASFLVSLYVRDSNSAAAAAFVKSHRQALALTALQRHELRNALRLAVFRTRAYPVPVTEADARTALAQIDTDIASGNLVECALPWSEAMAAAERLGAAHTMTLGVRGMDLLNVAAAVATKSRVFLTFDTRQRAVAQAAGLKVPTL
ncbi:MAG: type II toxin-antitoxin system VapC family toxin [Opitutaceae bacterium]|jgi:hypothetical protein